MTDGIELNLNDILDSENLDKIDNVYVGEQGAFIVLGDGNKDNVILIGQPQYEKFPILETTNLIDHVIVVSDMNNYVDDFGPFKFLRSTSTKINVGQEYPHGEFDDIMAMLTPEKDDAAI